MEYCVVKSKINKRIIKEKNDIIVLGKHMKSCMVEKIQSGKIEIIDDVVDLFKRMN